MYGGSNDEITTYHEGKLEHLLQIELNISACIAISHTIIHWQNEKEEERTYETRERW